MSMRSYAAEDYGFYIDGELANEIIKKVSEKEATDLYDINDLYNHLSEDKGIPVDFWSSCEGELFEIKENMLYEESDFSFGYDDAFLIISLKYFPTLFSKPSYKGIEDIIEEIKEHIGQYLPDNFSDEDIKKRIVHFVGITVG